MRHKPTLTPTARLILIAVAASTHPMSLVEIATATQASPYTTLRTTQAMVRAGLLLRQTVSAMSYFTLPVLAVTE
jgi:DNA-binding IclR family transcriptional regulator